MHRLSCLTAYGIFLDQRLKLCPLHWQVILNYWTTKEVPLFLSLFAIIWSVVGIMEGGLQKEIQVNMLGYSKRKQEFIRFNKIISISSHAIIFSWTSIQTKKKEIDIQMISSVVNLWTTMRKEDRKPECGFLPISETHLKFIVLFSLT